MKKKIALGLSALALAVAGVAYAAHHEGRPNPDSNGDGIVTRAESQAHAAALFAKLDANGDGRLEMADREAHRAKIREAMFARLDNDANGSISRDEFMAFKGPGQAEHAMGGPHGDGPGRHNRWGRRGHGGGMKMIEMADTDKDGSVSKAEFTAAAEKRFARIDADNNGQITEAERQTHRQQMREKWRERKDG